VATAYLGITLVMTWPLATGLTRDIPWDLGDSLLNCWIIAWVNEHVLHFLTGHLDAFRGFWTGNIFYPAPLTLAYSEHMVAEALQVLPVYLVSGNLILCYNLLFLSTFVLSALGMYLLVRELTGMRTAGFVAGLLYAFAPYRIGQYSHLQVLSSQWMPFALFAFRRYFETRRRGPLIGGVAAAIAQNLSCGYFTLFFTPFLVAYVLYEIVERRLWSDPRVWRDVVIAGILVAGVTAPFLVPYGELRQSGFPRRAVEEVMLYSADVYGYLTAHGAELLYGDWMRAYPKAEGDLFPAIVPVVLAGWGIATAIVTNWTRAMTSSSSSSSSSSRAADMIFFGGALVVALHVVATVVIFFTGGITLRLGPLPLRAATLWRVVAGTVFFVAILAAISPRARVFVKGVPRSAVLFFSSALLAAFWLSLGPMPMEMGKRLSGAALYWYFYEYVPGFDGLRVPARLAMLVALFLSVLAGYGLAAIERRWRKGAAVTLALGVAFLVEAAALPLAVNGTFASDDFVTPVSRVLTPARAPEVYRFLKTMPAEAVIAEFPFGDYAHELRYVYYSTVHWKRLLNGYSGGFPPSYMRHRAAFLRPLRIPDVAFDILTESGATHAIVHEGAFKGEEGAAVSEWLRSKGAQVVATFGRDRVFALPPR
jgi:hypothetical protein